MASSTIVTLHLRSSFDTYKNNVAISQDNVSLVDCYEKGQCS